MATFPYSANDGNIEVQWAIFTGLYFKSTGHLLNEAWKQFQENKISIPVSEWKSAVAGGRDTVMSLAYRFAPDTVWSCDSNFNLERNNYSRMGVLRSNQLTQMVDTVWYNNNYVDRKNWLWHRTSPIAWGERRFDESLRRMYTQQSNMFDFMDSAAVIGLIDDPKTHANPIMYTKSLRSIVDSRGDFVDHCYDDALGGTCYEQIECTAIDHPSSKFWTVHLFPVVKWFPRRPQDGMPLMSDSLDLSMSLGQAKKMRSLSLKYMDGEGRNKRANDSIIVAAMGDTLSTLPLLAYRKPYYADSISCAISVQFLPRDGDFGYLLTVIKNTDDARFQGFYVDRVPDRIVKVNARGNNISVWTAILRLYAENNSDDRSFDSLFSRCGSGWKELDIKIGEEYRFPSGLSVSSGRINSYGKNKRFDVWGLGFSRRSGQMNSLNPGGTTDALVMDTNYYEPRYVYNGCPCLPIPGLRNFSASDLRGIVYKMPPMCDVASMSNALYVLLEARKYLTNANDIKLLRQRIVQLGTALDIRAKTFGSLSPMQIKNVTAFCPDTWEMNFRDTITGVPLFESEYKPYMRGIVDSIKTIIGRSR